MARSTLLPPSLSAELPLAAVRAAVATSKAQALDRLQKTRRRCAQYSRSARQRAFSAGYAAGLQAASDDLRGALHAITATYDAALEIAKRDATYLGQSLAVRIIEQTLSNDPELLLKWIHDAATILSRSRTFTLSYHPRYTPLMKSLEEKLPERITQHAAAPLGEADFVLSGDAGGIECSWRKALLEEG